ncbi:MAG: type II secretion system protein GspG [Sandaracinaceae bacterium]
MAKSKFKSGRSLALPWERRGTWRRELFAGRRWRGLLVLGLVALGTFGVFRSAQHRDRMRSTRATLVEVQRAIDAFRADFGRCPQSLRELVFPPRGSRRYLRELPADGWGHALYAECPGRYDPAAADVVSAGPSGNFIVDDNLY